MKFIKVLIEEQTKRKIFEKHSVYYEEIEQGLLQGKPLVFRAKQERYMAITSRHRYITIIFTYEHGNVHIITAYPSSQWQIRLYKKKTQN